MLYITHYFLFQQPQVQLIASSQEIWSFCAAFGKEKIDRRQEGQKGPLISKSKW